LFKALGDSSNDDPAGLFFGSIDETSVTTM
jgi:hypothetical protein